MKKIVKVLLALCVAALAAIYGKTVLGFLKGLSSKKKEEEADQELEEADEQEEAAAEEAAGDPAAEETEIE